MTLPSPLNITAIPPPILTPQPPLFPPITDHWVLLILPIAVYWTVSMVFHYLDTHDLLSKYRLHTPEEVLARNHVSRAEVVRDVILQQVIQTIMGGVTALWEGVEMIGYEQWEVLQLYTRFQTMEQWGLKALTLLGINGVALEEKIARGIVAAGGDQVFLKAIELIGLEGSQDWRWNLVEVFYWYIVPVLRLGVAIFVLDTWQYFLHRAMHESKWLYKTFHSRHHRLYVPYAFGALYNHPFEGLLMDTIGAGLAYKISGLTTRGAMVFFCFSTLKTVDDHCGYALPWDPLQKMFWNNANYHDIHHQTWGIKKNFSQPFLICWDRWLGTQWNGEDVSARYAVQRNRAATIIAAKLGDVTPTEAIETDAATQTVAVEEKIEAKPIHMEEITMSVRSDNINGAIRRMNGLNGVVTSRGPIKINGMTGIHGHINTTVPRSEPTPPPSSDEEDETIDETSTPLRRSTRLRVSRMA
ncbi:sphingolipid C4-hydroxylase SUR2 [Pyronema domesticum]|uniref:Similar to Uncharacterized hydroxylase C887.15c acc. no. O94298 n=1 Tax=Pyronema omphalodes (strain CBS 100304) TaxID=1076935 RepID=U4L268_PYROM|nr:sphingolipid C4-hydroxylase SUR2 [Pyronema domesticum]CCX09235.1 Similar to Uncharacterized hydroxylase C887.15c; acc. no. O94298 [Pyronema omphalodes CBS 100304]